MVRNGPEGAGGVGPEVTAGVAVPVDFSEVVAVPLFDGPVGGWFTVCCNPASLAW